MDVSEVLLHILVVLLAAKGAAEISERIGLPAVAGEIVAGVIVGPSVLGFVGQDEVLRVLGELGVILLLLEVGMGMDLRELGAVGRAALAVAVVGVAVPFVGGLGVGFGLGLDGDEVLFLSAGLTATSVGITARVFGDLRALASVEARTVLGAAVADDVIGLVLLTVVTRVVAEGTVSFASLVWIVVAAVGFLVVATIGGVRLVPPVVAMVSRHSRSAGTLVAVTLAFTLAVAELADAARLAPIIGAFVAGLALGRSPSADRIRSEMTPVGHLLIPVFFLQIGIDAEIGAFADPGALGLAGVLIAVGILGKLASVAGMHRAPGDRLLVGIGMVPRGEVGLIFATIGLRLGVLGEDAYAALLLVVLVTTLVTPPALRWRLLQLRRVRETAVATATVMPAEGWLRDGEGAIELVHEPAPAATLEVALAVAARCNDAPPGVMVLDWLGRIPPGPLRWSRAAHQRFFDLLEVGGPRGWRLLAVTGVLERALPELGRAVGRRQAEAELDPLAALCWPRLSRVQEDGAHRRLAHPERVLLAALVLDATDGDGAPAVVAARKTAQRLDLGEAGERSVVGLVNDANLLSGVARRIDGLTEEVVLQLAAHLGSADQAEALHVLAAAADDLDGADRIRLAELNRLLRAALANPGLVGPDATNTVEQRRADAARLLTDAEARDRLAHAPRAYVLATAPSDLARHAALCDPVPRPGSPRVSVTPVDAASGSWRIEFVTRDRPGLLARETAVLGAHQLDVSEAVSAVWGDGCALSSFLIRAREVPVGERLAEELRELLGHPLTSAPTAHATLAFDDAASPWHTVCTVRARDQRGLLHAVATAFAAAGADVHAARVRTHAGAVVDVFELTDRKNHKLPPATRDQVRVLLAGGVAERKRRRWGRTVAVPATSVIRPEPA
jgi:Kef-type K+ transport system membrane component KefB